MGSLKKFASWLQGGKGGDKKTSQDNIRSTIMSLKIFSKRLARQSKKMDAQSRISKKKAIEARMKGDMPGSKMHMKSSIQFMKWSNATENFRVRLEGVQYKLQQAESMNNFSGVAQDIAGVLAELQNTVQAPQIAEIIGQLDLGFGNFEAIMDQTSEQLETSEDASSTGVSEDEVEQALAEIDAELSIDTRSALPSVPSMANSPEAEDLDDLEAEIAKLKSQRGNGP